jgi:O-antigen/teichoic acid export membrane protein
MAENPARPEGLAARTVKGSAYSIAASAVTMVLGFGRSVLMARLLAPEDFGVVAFAMTFLNFTTPLRDFGIDQALIHRKPDPDATPDDALAGHFSLRLILSAVFVLVLLASIPLLRHIWPGKTLLVPVLLALTAGKLAGALGATPTTYLRKEMRFRELAGLQVVTSLTMTIVGPVMAWQGWGVWAIVGEQVSGLAAATLVVWTVIRPWTPRWTLDWPMAKWYLGYGKYIFTTQGLNRVISEFDDFWVGAVLGSQPLGYYSKAYEFANYPRRVIGEPVAQVLFPAFAKVQDDPLRLSKAYYRASSLIVRAGFLIGGILVLGAQEFTVVFLKPKWLPMVSTFQLMVLYVLLEPLRAVSGNLVYAVGRPEFYTRARVVESLLSIPLVVLGARWWGIRGVAVAVDIVLFIGLSIILYQIRALVQISFFRMLFYPTVALGAGLLLGWQISGLVPDRALVQLAVKGLVLGTTYSLVLLLLEGREYVAYVQLFARLLGKPLTRSGVANE